MRIVYYSPNFALWDFLKTIFVKKSITNTINYFKELTGKEYILPTFSCRTALFLTYKAYGSNVKVSTSPLTCKAAIDPILAANQKVEFIDINIDNLNIDHNKIDRNNTDIVQIAYMGGASFNESGVIKRLRSNGIFIVEDCAQAFRARHNDNYIGREGDVSCFSLIKNAYGIGGGILATNEKEIYDEAKVIQNSMKRASTKIILYRVIKNILKTGRTQSIIFDWLYNKLMKYKNKNICSHESFDRYLRKPSKLFFKIFISQSKKFKKLHNKRKDIATRIIIALKGKGIIQNYSKSNLIDSSFTKLFLYNDKINTISANSFLNAKGIESKHLEQKYGSVYQQKFQNDNKIAGINSCNNYLKVHDSLISIPINEHMTNDDIDFLVQQLEYYLTND